MKVLYTAPFDPKYLALIDRTIGNVVQGPLEEDDLLSEDQMQMLLEREQPDIFIIEINRVTTEALDTATSLRVLGVCRSGTSNVDIEAATERGILVINTPGRNSVAVAELTIAGMISIARNLVQGVNLIRNRQWVDMVKTCYALEGLELANRTAGIVGIGAIGTQVAWRLKAFGMHLLGYDPFVDQDRVNLLGVEMTSLEDLIAESDFVIVLASVTDQNRDMFNAERLAMMKPGAFFVNMARAALVEEEALLNILRAKKIAGAVLDVHSEEPLPFDSPWLDLDNVLLIPHLGGATKEMVTNHSKMIFDDLVLLINGRRPYRLVNPLAWENFEPL